MGQNHGAVKVHQAHISQLGANTVGLPGEQQYSTVHTRVERTATQSA